MGLSNTFENVHNNDTDLQLDGSGLLPFLKIGFALLYIHYIALHSMDPKSVKMTIGCGICHINTNNTKNRMYSITEALTKGNPTQMLLFN
jgi:hypothetical protein